MALTREQRRRFRWAAWLPKCHANKMLPGGMRDGRLPRRQWRLVCRHRPSLKDVLAIRRLHKRWDR